MTTYKKISIKQLDTLFENLKPLNLERRQAFLKYSKHLIREDLISGVNEDIYYTIDYIRDFEEFERNYKKYKLREEIENEIEEENEFYDSMMEHISDGLYNIVFLYGVYKFLNLFL